MSEPEYVPQPENSTIHEQSKLLTININDEGFVDQAIPGASIAPLYLDSENGIWVLYVKLEPGASVPTHFHTGAVHLFTLKGEWYYKEYPDDIQTAGSYLFEPAGSYHSLVSDKGTEFFNVVIGSNVNFNPDGSFMNIMDAGWIAETLEKIAEETGKPTPRYIKAAHAKFTK